ncbi:hypothetical protein LCGC14_2303290 [marine sediment metagenome]|uniref:ParB/Sulfiredoxin domain-containing protein n=1 Tax=marine sediment metagenome TaxID=412755 RepID=A0A0F9CNA3_9ZZZZ
MKELSKSKMVKVRADSLSIHPYAQRALIPTKLKRLSAELDLDAIGVLHAVEYPIRAKKKLWIIDGQHRLRALLDHGFGEWLVEVKVHLGAQDDARASALFLKLNDRSLVRPHDKFKNELKSKHPVAVNTLRIVHTNGLEIGDTGADGKIVCISALKKLYQVDGGKTLADTLRTLLTAWGTTAASVEGKLVEGVGLVVHRFNGSIDMGSLTKKLSKYPGGASGLIGDARGIRDYRKTSLSRCIAERVIETYNSGKRSERLELL